MVWRVDQVRTQILATGCNKPSKGFTLIELLVVMVVIGIATSLVVLNFMRTATPLLAKQASFKLAVMNSNNAIADFRQSGLKIARSYLMNLAADVASIVAEKQDDWQYVPSTEELGFGKRVKTVSLGVDGTCSLFCAEGYREVMVGTLALYDEDGRRLNTTYVAQAPEYGKETFFAKMDREVEIMKGGVTEIGCVTNMRLFSGI